jgi:hypothetical protein
MPRPFWTSARICKNPALEAGFLPSLADQGSERIRGSRDGRADFVAAETSSPRESSRRGRLR